MLSKLNFLKRKEIKREGKIGKKGGEKREKKNGKKKLKYRHTPRPAMHSNEKKWQIVTLTTLRHNSTHSSN